MNRDDNLLKLLLLGDAGVGKSSLLYRFADDYYSDTYQSTIGIDFKTKIATIDGTHWILQIWDIAGEERFRTFVSAYLRGTDGVIIVYDVTDPNSFTNIKNWIQEIHQYAPKDVPVMLIGNKSDLTERKLIHSKRGRDLAKEMGVTFFESSAKNSTNVDRMFIALVKSILRPPTGRVACKRLSPVHVEQCSLL